MSVWRRTVDSGNVRQVGVSVDSENVVAVGTFGRQLRSLGLRRSAALLDFTNDDPVSALGVASFRGRYSLSRERERERERERLID